MLPQSADRRPKGRVQLRLIPALLAIGWLTVAAIRAGQLMERGGTSHLFARVWAISALSALAIGFLVYSAVTSRRKSERLLREAYDALARVEQLIDVSLSELSPEDLLPVMLERVCQVLDSRAAVLLMLVDEEYLEVCAAVGVVTALGIGDRLQIGQGVAGQVARERRPMSFTDLDQVVLLAPEVRSTLASAAGAPLMNQGRLVGVLITASEHVRDYDTEDLHALQLAADRCAVVMETAKSRDAERRNFLGAEHARRHLRLLVDASSIFMERVTDYESALLRLIDLSISEFAALGAMYVVDADTGSRLLGLRSRDRERQLDVFSDLPHSALTPIVEAMTTGRSRLVTTLPDTPFDRALRALGVTSYVIVPVTVRGLAFGALLLATTAPMRGYRPSDLAATEELGRRAAVAVEASLLYREAKESAELAESYAARLRTLVSAWLSVSTLLTQPNGLLAVLELARRTVDASAAHLLWEGQIHSVGDGEAPPPSIWQELASSARSARAEVAVGGSWVHVPVRDVAGRVDASLLVVGTAPSRHAGFTADDESLLLVLAQMLGSALANERLAQQFYEAQRLDAVGRLAGGVAHDFNNLLTVILGYADSMLRRLPDGDPQRDRIAAIARAGHRGAALTKQLLAVSRRQVVTPIVLRPIDVFAELQPLLDRVTHEDVRVHVVEDGDTRPIRIDESQFEQVLLNLVSNAGDAMPDGGEIFLECMPAPDPARVAVVVRDTGAGMDEATLEHCLEPFFTTKERGEGTGLGLAAVHGIVTQSGGEVRITSQRGEGTVVSLFFPAVDAPPELQPIVELPGTESAGIGSGTILLVEDEYDLRFMVRRLLRERGYVVMQAPSGAHALEMLAQYDGDLDLIVTDVVMPGIKGPDLARMAWKTRDVPVLFVSGYAEDVADLPTNPRAATSFLAKPFTPDELANQVRKLLVASRFSPRSGTPRHAPSGASEVRPDSPRSSS